MSRSLQNKTGRLLRFRRGAENSPFFFFESLQPTFNISRTLAEFWRDADLTPKDASADFGNLS
jgi:hypothetical protein